MKLMKNIRLRKFPVRQYKAPWEWPQNRFWSTPKALKVLRKDLCLPFPIHEWLILGHCRKWLLSTQGQLAVCSVHHGRKVCSRKFLQWLAVPFLLIPLSLLAVLKEEKEKQRLCRKTPKHLQVWLQLSACIGLGTMIGGAKFKFYIKGVFVSTLWGRSTRHRVHTKRNALGGKGFGGNIFVYMGDFAGRYFPFTCTKNSDKIPACKMKGAEEAWEGNESSALATQCETPCVIPISYHGICNYINTKTIGNKKGDSSWSCSRWQTQPEKICNHCNAQISVIHSAHCTELRVKLFEVTNTTWENLKIAKDKSVQYADRMTLICALPFADFLRLCLSPWTTSRRISFSISNSFWY